MKFPSGEANSGIKWISLLYRNPGNAAACAFVVITQQQQDGFPSPRNIWARALPQTSREEQRLACCFPAQTVWLQEVAETVILPSWCREHVGDEKARQPD